jgi:hypothetical protein
MNAVSFDRLTQNAAAGVSHRRSLITTGSRRTLLGAVCAGVLGSLLPDRTDAKKRKRPPCKKRKHGTCKKKKPDGTACRGGSCRSGRCVATCPNNTTSCGGICANLQTDEANCGSCGNSCAANQVCQTGTCFPRGICPSSMQLCTGAQHSCAATCKCASSVEGNTLCVQNAPFCSTPLPPVRRARIARRGKRASTSVGAAKIPTFRQGATSAWHRAVLPMFHSHHHRRRPARRRLLVRSRPYRAPKPPVSAAYAISVRRPRTPSVVQQLGNAMLLKYATALLSSARRTSSSRQIHRAARNRSAAAGTAVFAVSFAVVGVRVAGVSISRAVVMRNAVATIAPTAFACRDLSGASEPHLFWDPGRTRVRPGLPRGLFVRRWRGGWFVHPHRRIGPGKQCGQRRGWLIRRAHQFGGERDCLGDHLLERQFPPGRVCFDKSSRRYGE